MASQIVPIRTYLWVFLALLVLTGVTVAVALLNLGPANDLVAMLIATTKAMLVVVYFMHARHTPRLIWIIILVAGFWVVHLIGGTMSDYMTRNWPPS